MNATPSLIFRPDRGRKGYRLRCRFAVPAFPNEHFLEKAKFVAAEQFVKDMETQGWDYLDAHGFRMTGPYGVPIKQPELPRRSQQEQWQVKARQAQGAVQAGARLLVPPSLGGVATVPSLNEAESWEYELAGVFVRKTIVFEYDEVFTNDN